MRPRGDTGGGALAFQSLRGRARQKAVLKFRRGNRQWPKKRRPNREVGLAGAENSVNMNRYSCIFMRTRLLLAGVALWLVGTIGLRLVGERVLHPGNVRATLLLFAVSFPLMALVVRGLCRRFRLPRDQWLAGAVTIAAPTLLLDPFSSAFFSFAFPNIPPQAAGIFGGWMLICCAGALLGVLFSEPRRS